VCVYNTEAVHTEGRVAAAHHEVVGPGQEAPVGQLLGVGVDLAREAAPDTALVVRPLLGAILDTHQGLHGET